MKKLKLFSLLMLLFVGVTQLWAETATITFKVKGSGASGSSYITTETQQTTADGSNLNYKMNNWNPSTGQVRGGSSGGKFYIYNTDPIPGNITQIKINGGSYTFSKIYYKTATSAITSTLSSGTTMSSATQSITGSDTYFRINFASGATSGTVNMTSVEVTYEASSDPSVSGIPAEDVDMGSVKKGATTPTSSFTLTGENLTANLSLAFDNASGFTVSPTTITPAQAEAGQTVTISHSTDAADDFIGTLTISSDDFDDPFTVDYLLSVLETYAINVPAITGGTLGWDPAKPEYAAAGETFTLTATPSSGYEGGTIEIQKASDHSDVTSTYLSAGVLTMPAFAIDVIVSFDEKTCTPLTTPTGVEVTGNNIANYPYSNVAISWTAVTNADKYDVTIKNGSETVESETVTTTSYSLTNTLAANTTYTYEIVAKSNTPASHCDSDPASDNFTTGDYPAATLTLSENGVTRTWGSDLKITSVIELPTEVAEGNEVAGKVLVGWSATTVAETDDKPAYTNKGANFTMEAAAVTLYAVYAKETPGTPSTWELDQSDFDKVTESGSGYAPYNGSHTYSEIDYTTSQVMNQSSKIQFQKNTGVMYNTTAFANNIQSLAIDGISSNISVYEGTSAITETQSTGALVLSDGKYTFSSGKKFFRIQMGNATGTANSITVTIAGASSYSKYATSGVKAPSATIDPTSVAISAAALVGGLIDVTYENVNLANVTVDLFNDAECTKAFDGEWLTASLDANKDIVYGASANDSYIDARTAYIQLTAPASVLGPEPAVVIIPVEQAYKERVFASFDELKASDLPRNENTGTQVTVSFSNVAINSISNKSVYLEIEDAEDPTKYIQIYNSSNNAPAAWVQGGTLSGTALSGYWQLYNGAMELKVALDSNWTGVTYTAPSGTAVENVESSAKAVKVLKNGILLIEKANKTYNAQGQVVK